MNDYLVFDRAQLEHEDGTWSLEGETFGAGGVSVILVEMKPGRSVRLHRHPYPEIFVVEEGEATFTAGEATMQVSAPKVVVVSAGVAHKFVNTGRGVLRQTDIHLSGHFVTEWLE
jgi:mannose-6-phosphate isomerase-like protein (cupin superfamily)